MDKVKGNVIGNGNVITNNSSSPCQDVITLIPLKVRQDKNTPNDARTLSRIFADVLNNVPTLEEVLESVGRTLSTRP